MRLTVLGKSPAWQDAGGACSGYLVEERDTAVVVDCGNGVFSKLRRFRDYTAVDAVIISHLHADHFLDLVPFAYALTYAPRQQPVAVDRWPGTDAPARPRLLPGRSGRGGHLTPREAGEHGKAAAVRRIVITHISDELDVLWARAEAEDAFGGPVEIAREGAIYQV